MRRAPAVVSLFALAAAGAVSAEEGPGYRMPPPGIAAIADAPPTPAVHLDPSGRWLVMARHAALETLAELSREEHRLAGLRFHPATSTRSRLRAAVGLDVVAVADGSSRPVSGLPADPRLGDLAFAPGAGYLAFTHTSDSALELWVLDLETARARRLATGLNGVSPYPPFQWLSDGRSLVARLVPEDQGPPPERPPLPAGPVVQETGGAAAPARTYQDLLASPFDEALFAHYGTAQLVEVGLDGSRRALGGSGLVWRVEPSPDARFLLVERLERPFSYLVTHWGFPRRVEVWDRSGALVRELARIPLAETVPIGRNAVITGPRQHGWRSDADATVHWVEAQDGGDPRIEAAVRDRLFALEAPFESEPRELAALALRFREVYWGRDDLALVLEWWWADRQERLWRIAPAGPDPEASLVFAYSYEDRYAAPGRPLLETTSRGTKLLRFSSEGRIFLTAEGASPEGNRPFLDAFDVASGEKTRLFRSQAPHYEIPFDWIDADAGLLLTRRESAEEPPNFFVRDIDGGEPRALTALPHPYPGLAGAGQELVRYERDDGVALNATLRVPAGHREEDGPLPLLVWAYPREYKSADAAAQVRDSPYRFPVVRWGSPLYWLTRGYAVMQNATMPIVGEGDAEPNDRYVEQLVASAQAAVDEAVRRGVADPERVAIGGHSYGAFMTANLLAHSDIFRAGIARSGAYNRSLTPFGFQSEQRTFWEAPEVYFAMSPFMHAHRVNEPILLIHGEADNNSGTFPVQSRRFFHALKGHSATARLVMLPHESHGYRTRESVMHTLWEMDRWLEAHVKNAPPRDGS